jgi:hypothetical protein
LDRHCAVSLIDARSRAQAAQDLIDEAKKAIPGGSEQAGSIPGRERDGYGGHGADDGGAA